jgi:hypothetical protein
MRNACGADVDLERLSLSLSLSLSNQLKSVPVEYCSLKTGK